MNNKTESVWMAPHSVEAEEAVLGSILIDPEAIFRVSPLLHADDFFIVKNGWVWGALLALHEGHAPIDFLTACHELEARGQLDEIGGAAYISHLINVVPTAIHVEGYAMILRKTSLRRKMLQAASDIAQLAYDEIGDVDEQLDRAEQALLEIRGHRSRSAVESLPPLVGQDELPALYRAERLAPLSSTRGRVQPRNVQVASRRATGGARIGD